MSMTTIENQPQVVGFLRKVLRKGRLPHALLFQGPKDSGQKETVLWLIKTLFCEKRAGDGAPCGSCASCHLVERGSHPDLLWVKPEEESPIIRIEQIREAVHRMNLQSFQARWKAAAIDEAHSMNEVSQNALLKTLEEPTGRALFILISSHPEKLLSTVRSRLVRLRFFPLLKTKEEAPEAAALLETLLGGVYSPAAIPDLSGTSRENLCRIMDHLTEYFREALLLRMGLSELLPTGNVSKKVSSLASISDEEELQEKIEFTAQIKEKIQANMNVKLLLQAFWAGLLEKTCRTSII
ncbi:MAG: DNA polymerase III subunit [Candidatus Omnitrophica bacterium]|nr:DNA polymerase III subunit [Candidatus Omnitrophota bacterium]